MAQCLEQMMWVLQPGVFYPVPGQAVGVVQPDISPVAKEYGGFWDNFEILKPLTVQATQRGAQLVVWPETAAAFLVNDAPPRPYQEGVQALVDSLNVYLYAGAYRRVQDERTRTYNTSFLFAPGRGAYWDPITVPPPPNTGLSFLPEINGKNIPNEL